MLARGRVADKRCHVLFIAPTTEADEGPQASSSRGYNLVSWRRAHLRAIAVSDLNADELLKFSQLQQQGR